jgi:hypothetical protein
MSILLRRIFFRWAQLAVPVTGLCLLAYLLTQQSLRGSANDPQLQWARDAAVRLASGQPVDQVVPAGTIDYSRSDAPFLMVVNDTGTVVASSGRLRADLRTVPVGVFDEVRRNGEERVTWQPEHGVRMASAVVRIPGTTGGFVVAARSLRNTEERVDKLQSITLLAWLLTLGAMLVVTAITEYFLATGGAGLQPGARRPA